MALMIGCILHGLDALQGTRAKPGNHLVLYKRRKYTKLQKQSSAWNKWRDHDVTAVIFDKKVSRILKHKIYKTAVIPTMVYWTETWETKKREENIMIVYGRSMNVAMDSRGDPKQPRSELGYQNLVVVHLTAYEKEAVVAWTREHGRRDRHHTTKAQED